MKESVKRKPCTMYDNTYIESLADQYCIKNFGSATGNKPVRDAFIAGYYLMISE